MLSTMDNETIFSTSSHDEIAWKKNEIKKFFQRANKNLHEVSLTPLRPIVASKNTQTKIDETQAIHAFYDIIIEIRNRVLEVPPEEKVNRKLNKNYKRMSLDRLREEEHQATETHELLQKKPRIYANQRSLVDSLETITNKDNFLSDPDNRDALVFEIFSILLQGEKSDVLPILLTWLEAMSMLKIAERGIILFFKELCRFKIEERKTFESGEYLLDPVANYLEQFRVQPTNENATWDTIQTLDLKEIPLLYQHTLQYMMVSLFSYATAATGYDYVDCSPFIRVLQNGAKKGYFPHFLNKYSEEDLTKSDLLPNYLLTLLSELYRYSHVVDLQFSYKLNSSAEGMQTAATEQFRLFLIMWQFSIFGKNSQHVIAKEIMQHLLAEVKNLLENFSKFPTEQFKDTAARSCILNGIRELFLCMNKLDYNKLAGPALFAMHDSLLVKLLDANQYTDMNSFLKFSFKENVSYTKKLSNTQLKIQIAKLNSHLNLFLTCALHFLLNEILETQVSSESWLIIFEQAAQAEKNIDFCFNLFKECYPLFSAMLADLFVQAVAKKIEEAFRQLSGPQKKSYKQPYAQVKKTIYYITLGLGGDTKTIVDIFQLDTVALSNSNISSIIPKKKSKAQAVVVEVQETEQENETPFEKEEGEKETVESLLTLARKSEPKPIAKPKPIPKAIPKIDVVAGPKQKPPERKTSNALIRKKLDNHKEVKSVAAPKEIKKSAPPVCRPAAKNPPIKIDSLYHPSGTWAQKVAGEQYPLLMENKVAESVESVSDLPPIALDVVEEHMQSVLKRYAEMTDSVKENPRFVSRELLPAAILDLFQLVAPDWCIFLVGSTVTDYFFRLAHNRDYDFCFIGKHNIQTLYDLFSQYPDVVKNINIRKKKSPRPVLHFDVWDGKKLHEVDIVCGTVKPGETIQQAMQRRRQKETDFNVFALSLDITRSILQKLGFLIEGDIESIMKAICVVGDNDGIFFSDPRRLFARVIKAKTYYPFLDYSEHLQGLLNHKNVTFHILKMFFSSTHPTSVLNAENFSTDLEYLLHQLPLSRVLAIYQDIGILSGATQLNPNHFEHTLKFVPACNTLSTGNQNIFASKQKMLTITFMYANVSFFNKFFNMEDQAFELWQKTPLLTLIKSHCIGYAYTMYVKYIDDLVNDIDNDQCLYDPSYKFMIKNIREYYFQFFLEMQKAMVEVQVAPAFVLVPVPVQSVSSHFLLPPNPVQPFTEELATSNGDTLKLDKNR